MTTTGIIQTYSGDVITEPFDVRRYGAVGDGTTDDTTAIQDAINAAAAYSRGGVVYFPATSTGAYRTTAALTVTSGQIRLMGDLFACSNIWKDHAGDLLQVTGPSYAGRISYVTLAHLRLVAITAGAAAINATYT